MEKIKAVIYCRVSPYPDPEISNYHCNLQKQILTEKAALSPFDITDYYMDVGFSGNDMKRPALQKLLHDFNDGKFEIVLVCNSDRLLTASSDEIVDWPFPVLSVTYNPDFKKAGEKIAHYMRSIDTSEKSIVQQRRTVRRKVQKLGFHKRWR